ncbi:allatostatin [Leptidea sinapis]|uniref:allatostatin n=1 Tax=Leptidea sinapis TaxID=189913 RepID=UPI0021310302|nr:allatostatin [Leptidea sinapis]
MIGSSSYRSCSLAVAILTVCLANSIAYGVPLINEDEQAENTLLSRSEMAGDADLPWDAVNAAALRKMLIQLDAEDGMGRVGRSWPQAEARGWGLRSMDGRMNRPWRADKRQARFRQCYFNPISCFRK